jgi:diadenylate cyclase
MGLRHRAAIGISESTDAIVLVVSEETGSISLVQGGNIERQLTPEKLTELLQFYLVPKQPAG